MWQDLPANNVAKLTPSISQLTLPPSQEEAKTALEAVLEKRLNGS
jgi:hypothetical protein